MGGAWERLIRSVKTTLRVILKSHLPTEEILRTTLVECEAIVNSRPLTFVSLDHHDEDALTPNHLLLGSSSPSSPPAIFEKPDLCHKKQWRAVQKTVDHFWSRWVKEFLPCLTRRVIYI